MEAEMCFASVKDTLYKTVLGTIVGSQSVYNHCREGIITLGKKLQFDIYHEFFVQRKLCELFMELSQFRVFSRLLGISEERIRLHSMFQGLMDYKPKIIQALKDEFCEQLTLQQLQEPDNLKECLRTGCNLGRFFSEAGWFAFSEEVYQACLDAVNHDGEDDDEVAIIEDESEANPSENKSEANLSENKRKDNLSENKSITSLSENKRKDNLSNAFDYCLRLFQVQNKNYRYEAAKNTYQKASLLMKRLSQKGSSVNCALLYAEQCILLQAQSHWKEAFEACFKALQELNRSLSSVPVLTVIDVLKTCAMTYAYKGEFKKAEVLLQQAVYTAKKTPVSKHIKYADVLLEYGFFLQKIGVYEAAVHVYEQALSIHVKSFGGHNLNVAIAHIHVAAAAYMLEYTNDKSGNAKQHAQKGVDILVKILPQDHTLMYLVKRFQALIKQGMVVNTQDRMEKEQLLSEAHTLHTQSRRIVEKFFGEKSMQMAQNYNAVALIYWSMHQFMKAKDMYLKEMDIKESLFGSAHYSMALPKCSLAFLYNYNMNRYEKAKELYMHSINISKNVFGEGYVGLGQTYDDLQKLYEKMGNHEQAQHYSTVMQNWKDLRAQMDKWTNPLDIEVHDTLENIISKNFLS